MNICKVRPGRWRLASLALVALFTSAAQTKKPTKAFVPPAPTYALDPVVSKDAGCARDYAKASLLEGVEQRKALADLVTYACTERVGGVYHASVSDSKTITINEHSFLLREVSLIAVTQMPETKEQVLGNDRVTAEGWVLATDLIRLSDDDLKMVLKHRIAKQ